MTALTAFAVTVLAIGVGLPTFGQNQWPDPRLRFPIYLQNGVQLPQGQFNGNAPQVITDGPVPYQAGYPRPQSQGPITTLGGSQGPITIHGGPYPKPVQPITIHGGTVPGSIVDCGVCPPGQSRQNSFGSYCGECVNDASSCSPGYYLEGTSCLKCPCPETDYMGIRCRGCHKEPNGQVVCDCNPNYAGSKCQNCAQGCIQRDNYPYDCFKPNGTTTCAGSGCSGWSSAITVPQLTTVTNQVVSSCRGSRCGQLQQQQPGQSACASGNCPVQTPCGGAQCRMPATLCPGCNCRGVGCPCDSCNFNPGHYSTAVYVNQTCPPCNHQHSHCPPCNANCPTCGGQQGGCQGQQQPCGQQGGCPTQPQPCGQSNTCQCPPPCPSCCNQCGNVGCPPPTVCPPVTTLPPPPPPPPTTTLAPPVICDSCCDPRGTYSYGTSYSRFDCTCKINVMGGNCDMCKSGYFGLSSNNPNGCSACFCSGVSNQCSEAVFQRTYITLYGTGSGLTMVNLNTGTKIDQNILNYNGNVKFTYSDPSARRENLYWVLPADFIGGRLSSYGGTISAVRSFSTTVGGQSVPGNDIIIQGTYGHYIYWASPDAFASGTEREFSVKLEEGNGWLSLHNGNSHVATRRDIMLVLADIEAILIRATLANPAVMQTSSIRSISMASAVADASPGLPLMELTSGIEQCICPVGYQGASCESCSQGFYRDYTDLSSGVFGTCRRCPCGVHSKGCSLENGQITCHCKDGYSGPDCRGCVSLSMTMDPMECRDCFNANLRYTCSYTGPMDNLEIKFSTIPDWSVLTSFDPSAVLGGIQQGKTGTLSIPLLRGLSRVVCQIKNAANDVLIEAKSIVVGEDCSPPGPPIPPPNAGLTLSTEFICIFANETAVVTCNSNYDPNAPIYWVREGYNNLPYSVQADRNYLRFINPSVEDSGTYMCISSGGIIPGIHTKKLAVRIKSCTIPNYGGGNFIHWRMYGDSGGNSSTSKQPTAFVNVQSPLKLSAGDKVELTCDGVGKPTPVVTFSRSVGGQETTLRKSDHSGVSYEIASASENDQGTYLCTAENSQGKDTNVLEILFQDTSKIGLENTGCTESEFKCRNSECIPISKKCDGVKDCKDGSDEKGKVCNKVNKSKQV